MKFHVAAGLLAVISFGSLARADYPMHALFSEQQPPTLQDWHMLQLRQMQRCCPHRGPMVLPREIHYYPCPRVRGCDEPVHQSDKGVYGCEHPMPYYLPNPQILVEVPGGCHRCSLQQDWRFRQELPTKAEKLAD